MSPGHPMSGLSVQLPTDDWKEIPHLMTLSLPSSRASTAHKSFTIDHVDILSSPVINCSSEGCRGPPAWALSLGSRSKGLMKAHPENKYIWVCSLAQKYQRKQSFLYFAARSPSTDVFINAGRVLLRFPNPSCI